MPIYVKQTDKLGNINHASKDMQAVYHEDKKVFGKYISINQIFRRWTDATFQLPQMEIKNGLEFTIEPELYIESSKNGEIKLSGAYGLKAIARKTIFRASLATLNGGLVDNSDFNLLSANDVDWQIKPAELRTIRVVFNSQNSQGKVLRFASTQINNSDYIENGAFAGVYAPDYSLNMSYYPKFIKLRAY